MSIVVRKMEKMHKTIESILSTYKGEGPIRCFWPERIKDKVREFQKLFRGQIVYAVKCNPDLFVLDALKAAGVTDFDVASINEIKTIHEWDSHARLYFQHPIKSRSSISSAYRDYKVRHFAVDHSDELDKLYDQIPSDSAVTVYVRLATPDLGVTEDLSEKFGASIEEAVVLLKSLQKSKFAPAISFHVGSQCYDPKAYRVALSMVSELLMRSTVSIRALNVGGGFPAKYLGTNIPPLVDYMSDIGNGLESQNLPKEVKIFCEPGRGLVADGMSVVARVQLRKKNSLYISDGIFGHFLEAYFHKFVIPARAIRPAEQLSQDKGSFKVFGPTCDGNDVLPGELQLPYDIREGDWIEFSNMGAYSLALSSNFNGFQTESSFLME